MRSVYLRLFLLVPVIWFLAYIGIPSLDSEVFCSDSQPSDFEQTPPTDDSTPITIDNIASLTLISTLHHGDLVTDIEFTPDGKRLVSSSTDIKIWDLVTYDEIHTFHGHTEQILSIAVSPDSMMLASGSRDDSVKLWDLTSLAEIISLQDYTQDVHDVLFDITGNTLITASSQNSALVLWDTSNYTLRHRLRTDLIVDAVALHASGDCAIISYIPKGATAGSLISLIDMNTGEEEVFPHSYRGNITEVEFSPTGHIIASAGLDETVRLWDVESKSQLAILTHHSNVNGISFNPTGDLLASAVGDLGGAGDNSIIIWDLKTGLQVNRLTGYDNLVSDVEFNSTGDLLASTSFDGTIHLWKITY